MQKQESIEQRVIELLDRIEAGAVDAAPEAADITLQAVYLDGLMRLIGGSIALVALIIFYWFVVRRAIYFSRREIDEKGEIDLSILALFGSGGCALILLALTIVHLLNRIAWISVINPEAGLALRIMEGTLNGL